MKVTYDQIRQAMKSVRNDYVKIELAGEEATMVLDLVNQGIDSHLEACFVEGRDGYEWDGCKLQCKVSPESLPVLLRRLYEHSLLEKDSSDSAESLLGSIIVNVLEINVPDGDVIDVVKDDTQTPIRYFVDIDVSDDDDETGDLLEGSMTAEEYASLWGGDPSSDRPPRIIGDGYKFYNFHEEGDDPEFLREFIPAIERTIACCVDRPRDQKGLQYLKSICEERLSQV